MTSTRAFKPAPLSLDDSALRKAGLTTPVRKSSAPATPTEPYRKPITSPVRTPIKSPSDLGRGLPVDTEEDEEPPPPPPEEFAAESLEDIKEDEDDEEEEDEEELPPPPPMRERKIPQFRQKMALAIAAEEKEKEEKEKEEEKKAEMKESYFENLTFNDMRHQFPILDEQVKGGILLVRRFHNYLRRVALAQEKFSSDLIRAHSGEDDLTKSDTVFNTKDDMTLHYDAVLSLQSLTTEWGKRLKAFAFKITDSILPNLLLYCKQAEGKRQILVKEEQRLTAEAAGYAKELESRRMECLKSWNELIALKKVRDKKAMRAAEKEKESKESKKSTKKKKLDEVDLPSSTSSLPTTPTHNSVHEPGSMGKAKDKTRKLFRAFEDLLQDMEPKLNNYRFSAYPGVLEGMELLERERLSILHDSIACFREMESAFTVASKASEDLEKKFILAEVETDVKQCIETWLDKYGHPTPHGAIAEPLPCRSSDFGSDAWERSKAAVVATEVTGTTLAVMTPIITRQSVPTPNTNSSEAAKRMSSASFTGDVKSSMSTARPRKGSDDLEDDDDEYDGGANYQFFRGDKTELEPWVYCVKGYTPKAEEKDYLTLQEEDVVRIINRDNPDIWLGEILGSHQRPRGKFSRHQVMFLEYGIFKKGAPKDSVLETLRAAVSKKKRRFQSEGFNLDLTYITPHIIAMGFPSESFSGLYRNPLKEVQRFFQLRHPDSYKVYNLCSEREYSPEKFDGRVVRYPFDDHNPCLFNTIEPFCLDVKDFLTGGPKQTKASQLAAIHCKAGKGRTGFLIACYLQYCGLFDNAEEALRYYAYKRTSDARGVTIPSQLRYVYYWEKYLRLKKESKSLPERNPMILVTIRVYGLPPKFKNPWFTITSEDGSYTSKGKIEAQRRPAEDYVFFAGTGSTGIAALDHDVKMAFYYEKFRGGKKVLFQLWFNTRFMTEDDIVKEQDEEDNQDTRFLRLNFLKWQLDKACKDHKNKHYSDSFRLELLFKSV